jgi:hypothetical protein
VTPSRSPSEVYAPVWIGCPAAAQFLFAVQIVDFYQARQHLGRLAEAQLGAGSHVPLTDDEGGRTQAEKQRLLRLQRCWPATAPSPVLLADRGFDKAPLLSWLKAGSGCASGTGACRWHSMRSTCSMLPMRDLSGLPAKPVLPFAWSPSGLQVGTAAGTR